MINLIRRFALPALLVSAISASIITVDAADKAEEHKPAAEHKAEAKAAEPAKEEASRVIPYIRQGEGCITDASAIDDIKKQKESLEAAKKELSTRETELKARETALNEELKKLQVVRDEIAAMHASHAKESEDRVTKLVETVEAMSPKAGSQLLTSLDETLAVQTMSRLSTAKLGKIMNVMDASRSSRLAERMAGVVRAKRASNPASDGAAVTTTQSTKGGESNVGHNNENQSDSNGGKSAAGSRNPGSKEGKDN